jgi:hypothetical protein
MLPNLVHEYRQELADEGTPRPVGSRQQITDDQFGRAMQRAKAREAAS